MADDANVPWSAPDVAKALRDMLGASRGLLDIFREIAKIAEHRNARQAAGVVGGMVFVPDGMRRPLERIARGEGSQKDVDVISKKYSESAERVKNSMDRLRSYRNKFMEQAGLGATLELYDEVIWGEKYSKEGIRKDIDDLVNVTALWLF